MCLSFAHIWTFCMEVCSTSRHCVTPFCCHRVTFTNTVHCNPIFLRPSPMFDAFVEKICHFWGVFINQFWSSVTVWHTWKFKESLLVHKRSWRWPNIFFVTLWICTWVGKIVFSLISKHLKLDFSMSHSDKQSRSEQISPRTERQKDRKIERLEVENTMNRTQKTFTRSPMNS